MTSLYDCTKPFATMYYSYGHNAYMNARPIFPFQILHYIYKKLRIPGLAICLISTLLMLWILKSMQCSLNGILGMRYTLYLLLITATGNFMTVASHATYRIHENKIHDLFWSLRQFPVSQKDAAHLTNISKFLSYFMNVSYAFHVLLYKMPLTIATAVSLACFVGHNMIEACGDHDLYEFKKAIYPLILCLAVMTPFLPPDGSFLGLSSAFTITIWCRLMFHQLKEDIKHEKCVHARRQKFNQFCHIYLKVQNLLERINHIISPILHVTFLISITTVTYALSLNLIRNSTNQVMDNVLWFILVANSPVVVVLLLTVLLFKTHQLNKEVGEFVRLYQKASHLLHNTLIIENLFLGERTSKRNRVILKEELHCKVEECIIENLNHLIFFTTMKPHPLQSITIDWFMEINDIGLLSLFLMMVDIAQLAYYSMLSKINNKFSC